MYCFTAIVLLLAAAPLVQAQIVINEIHAVPSAGEPEWIELFNTYNQVRILRNAFISDRTSTRALPDIRIPARGFAVLTRDTFALTETRVIPPGTVLVEIKLPSLNNTTDAVVLRSADSTALDSVYYNTKWSRRGVSIERIDPLAPAVSNSNFAACETHDSATAGMVNSVVLVDRDARLLAVHSAGDSIVVHIRNNGRKALSNGSTSLWIDTNADGILHLEELWARETISAIDSGTVHTWSVFTGDVQRGYVQSTTVVDYPGDERRTNDTLRRTLYFSYPRAAIQINELMFNPPAGSCDYVELWNASADTVQMQGWCIHDRATASGADSIVIEAAIALPPGAYMVVAADSSLLYTFPALTGNPYFYCGNSPFNLNATGDMVVLRDPNGSAIDSISYTDDWHIVPVSSSDGISIEKINPVLPSAQRDSWSTAGATGGGTPGMHNSIAMPLPARGSLGAEPNPFVRSRSDICLISWVLPFRQARVSATVYSTSGLPQRTLLSAEFTATQGFAVWNGSNDSGAPLPPGAYVVVLEAIDAATGSVDTQKLIIALH